MAGGTFLEEPAVVPKALFLCVEDLTGRHNTRARDQWIARMPTAEESNVLDLPTGAPVLHVVHTARDENPSTRGTSPLTVKTSYTGSSLPTRTHYGTPITSTIQGVGFTDEVPDGDLRAITHAAHHYLAGAPVPTLRFHRLTLRPQAVALYPRPSGSIHDIRHAIRHAIAALRRVARAYHWDHVNFVPIKG